MYRYDAYEPEKPPPGGQEPAEAAVAEFAWVVDGRAGGEERAIPRTNRILIIVTNVGEYEDKGREPSMCRPTTPST
ncbi:hypothetical protein [Planctomyces sp. SH-PL62]|uniref:hypothetical protein n=1 Tax=Planctomyces sp. SH-PL62 TaxID=1636152 RepID=UPI00078BF686|nr:hypothetical protein [Planctomyces sp. SH-PL62]AMV40149.1 hypothetical protein VT85_22135 [Planctomyces sp. SH-PL62]